MAEMRALENHIPNARTQKKKNPSKCLSVASNDVLITAPADRANDRTRPRPCLFGCDPMLHCIGCQKNVEQGASRHQQLCLPW